MGKKKPKKNKGLKIKFTNIILLSVIFLLVLVVIFQKLQVPRLNESTHDLTVGVSSRSRTSSAISKPSTLPSGFSRDKSYDTIKTVTQQQVASESAKKVIQKPEVLIPNHSGNQLRVPILMYHYIGNNPNPKDLARNSLSVTPDKFEEQMRYLHDNGYTGISLDTMYAALHKLTILPPKPVVLTFDDGYMDFFYNAFPVLLKYNLHATEFIPTGLINQGYYLTWLQIKQMQASGLVTFGAHTVHHYNLPSLSNESALYELSESKKVLQEQLGVPINFMAFPNGATNNTIIELTKKAGYIGSVGTWPDKTQSEGTIYNMPRLRITGSTDINIFAQLL